MSSPDFAGLFTPDGLLCFLAGIAVRRLYCALKIRWLDRKYPEEAPHRQHLKAIVLGWGLVIVGILYVGVQAQVTRTETVQQAKENARCWSEAYQSTRAQIDLNAQNDNISRQQLQAQRDYDRETVKWISELIAPPGDLANQEPNSPARQAYGIKVSQEYFAHIDALGAQFDQLVAQRQQLDAQRAQHPLPETTCGR